LAQEAPGGQPMTFTKRLKQTNDSFHLEHLRKRFDFWRRSRKPRMRIPDKLWDSAVQVAGQCGLHRTAKTLHLDYYTLKKRLDGIHVTRESSPSFIELRPPVREPVSECLIELEKRNGAKMRIHIKGNGTPDLNAIGTMFWRDRR
jgi:hypothetical protein